MKRLPSTAVILLALFVVPLLGHPALILHAKPLLLMAVFAALWLSQPALTREHARQPATDLGSVWVILGLSFPALAVSLVDWAYFQEAERRSMMGIMASLALVLLLGGLTLRIAAIQSLGRFFTPTVRIVERHELVTTGLYRWVRHPSYSGAYACFLGSALWLGSWPGLMAAGLCMGAAYAWRIRVEEQALVATFGDAYREYQRRTKRLAPGLW